MKLFFRSILKIFIILTILAGCATTEEIKESDSVALLNQGLAFAKKGQYDLSINYLNKAIEINPRLAEAYINRGVAYQAKGQYDKTISDYNKAIEINPGLAEAYYNRGGAYFFKREYEKAWDDVHKAEGLGWQVDPGFLKALRDASGRQK
jgi:tetratricopeptide (TPR) repeat protein